MPSQADPAPTIGTWIRPQATGRAITPRAEAIMPAHLTGRICNKDRIIAIARAHNLNVIEDAAQSMGSEYKANRSGTLRDIGCISCHRLKNMNACETAAS